MHSSKNFSNTPLWNMRHLLFSKFDQGIQFDEIGLRTTKPEESSLKLWNIIRGNTILDWFCWLWSNAIGFARAWKKVITCDINQDRLEMAKNNAKIYGVYDQIQFIHGSVLDYISLSDYDSAYFDPPWSDDITPYSTKEKFSFLDYKVDGNFLLKAAREKTKNVIFAIPKNFDFSTIENFEPRFLVTKENLGSHLSHYTLFFDLENNFENYSSSILFVKNTQRNNIITMPSEDIPRISSIVPKELISPPLNHPEQELKQSLYSLVEQRMFRYAVRIRDEYGLKTEEEIKNKFYEIVRDVFDFSYGITQNNIGISIENLNVLHGKLFPKGLWWQSIWPNGQAMKTLFPTGVFRNNREFRMYDMVEFDYMHPEAIESEIINANNLIQERNDLHILVRLVLQLHRYWHIHPYYNGNGTLFSLVLGIQLIQNGYAIPRDFSSNLQKMVDDRLFLKADSGDYEELIERFLSLFCKHPRNVIQ